MKNLVYALITILVLVFVGTRVEAHAGEFICGKSVRYYTYDAKPPVLANELNKITLKDGKLRTTYLKTGVQENILTFLSKDNGRLYYGHEYAHGVAQFQKSDMKNMLFVSIARMGSGGHFIDKFSECAPLR